MAWTKRGVFLVTFFFCIAIINAVSLTNYFQYDTGKTSEYITVDYEKESEKEKDQIDKFTINLFVSYIFSSISTKYRSTQKKNPFKIFFLLYKPPSTI